MKLMHQQLPLLDCNGVIFASISTELFAVVVVAAL
jgi:hypothetical protein